MHSPLQFPAQQFNPTAADPHHPGGRFDSDGSYGYLYAAETLETALAEKFIRGPAVANPMARYLPVVALRGLRVSELEVTDNTELLPLCTAKELARLGQDPWLTHCDEPDYVYTCRWGAKMHEWAPIAAGFRWISKRDTPKKCVVLYSDRTEPSLLVPTGQYFDLDSPAGEILVLKTLRHYNVTISRP